MKSKSQTIKLAIDSGKKLKFTYTDYQGKKSRKVDPLPATELSKEEQKRVKENNLVPVLEGDKYKTFSEEKMKSVKDV